MGRCRAIAWFQSSFPAPALHFRQTTSPALIGRYLMCACFTAAVARPVRSQRMGPDASTVANVFSSRVITRELLWQESSRPLEACRVVAPAAFARAGSGTTGQTPVPDQPTPEDRWRTAATPKPLAVPRSRPITLRNNPQGVAAINHSWTFTYANGTFSSVSGQRTFSRIQTGVRPQAPSWLIPTFRAALRKAA